MVDDQQPGGPQPATAQPGWPAPQQAALQPGWPTAPQPGAPQGYPQPGYPQPGYPQPGYPQPGYPQAAYQQPGAPGSPTPAYAAPGYPPQAAGYPQSGGYPPGYAPPPGYGAGYAPGIPYANIPYAGFWIRFAAYLLDGLILSAILILCAVTIVGIILIPFIGLGYMPWMWWKRGRTLGQQALGLRVVRAIDGGPITGDKAVVRLIGIILSGWALYIGLIWVAFEPRKRGWHDMLADTVVIHSA